MNETSIGAIGGQVENIKTTATTKTPKNPLDLFSPEVPVAGSFDSSPTLTNFSNASQPNTVISTSEKLKSPVNLILCSIILFIVAGLWLAAGYLVQTLTPVYDSPSMLTYLSVISLQIYFFFIPRKPKFPNRRSDGSLIVDEADLGFDTYTNREAFKIAGYLFALFTLSIGLILKGLSMFPQSSYSGSIGLLAISTLAFLVMGMRTESVTRHKVISVGLLTLSAIITILEPVLWDNLDLSSMLNYGLACSIVGILFLALFFVLLMHQVEHTNIHKPMLFGFIGLFCMLIMWISFIPLHLLNWEVLVMPPPKEDIYWSILGVVMLGTVIPFYMIQWVLTRTSVLFVCVLLGSIIPLYGITESVYFLEFNWYNLLASVLSAAAIFTIHYHYK